MHTLEGGVMTSLRIKSSVPRYVLWLSRIEYISNHIQTSRTSAYFTTAMCVPDKSLENIRDCRDSPDCSNKVLLKRHAFPITWSNCFLKMFLILGSLALFSTWSGVSQALSRNSSFWIEKNSVLVKSNTVLIFSILHLLLFLSHYPQKARMRPCLQACLCAWVRALFCMCFCAVCVSACVAVHALCCVACLSASACGYVILWKSHMMLDNEITIPTFQSEFSNDSTIEASEWVKALMIQTAKRLVASHSWANFEIHRHYLSKITDVCTWVVDNDTDISNQLLCMSPIPNTQDENSYNLIIAYGSGKYEEHVYTSTNFQFLTTFHLQWQPWNSKC